MRNLAILFASTILFACGDSDSTESDFVNPIDETADAMHEALDEAEAVGAKLEEQKQAIDAALEEAEGVSPD
jgi:hypothetical protein